MEQGARGDGEERAGDRLEPSEGTVGGASGRCVEPGEEVIRVLGTVCKSTKKTMDEIYDLVSCAQVLSTRIIMSSMNGVRWCMG